MCKSPATLKTLLKGLPRGSTLDWWPTCSGESEALAGHLDDLKKICTDAGIVFKDLHTSQKSLEDIFVGLVSKKPTVEARP